MPLVPSNQTPIPIRPPDIPDPTAMSGELYLGMVIIIGLIILGLFLFWIVIRIWGNPILTAKSSRMSGDAIIQHFENSKIGSLKLAAIGGGALRHKKIVDGTLITIPKGINNLDGHSFVNSWSLTGISVPIFLMGAATKLRHLGIMSRAELQNIVESDQKNRHINLIPEAYNFDSFKDVIQKSKEPALIPLEIEHVDEYIESVNQHYTEAEITKEVSTYTMGKTDGYLQFIITMSISLFIISLAGYFFLGSIK